MSIDTSAALLARVGAAFAQAWSAAADERCETAYAIDGAVVRLRILGRTLATNVHPAIAHLALPSAATPTLRIDLWDARVGDASDPPDVDVHALGKSWRLGDGTFAASADGRIVVHQLGGAVIGFDRQAQQMTGWYADGGDLSLHQRGKPLQLLLSLWASDRGLQAVHAALIARDGAGVLIPGSSGSGKSTAALACAQAGYTYFGDDWVGIATNADGTLRGHGLYNSTFLATDHAPRFPHVLPRLIHPREGGDEKALLLLNDLHADRLGQVTTLRVLALPRIVEATSAGLQAASKREALLKLLPSSVFEMHPRPDRAGIDRLTQLVERVPAYWLEIGPDLDEVPRRVDAILRQVGAI